MKKNIVLFSLKLSLLIGFSINAKASVPTEEGLLRNLNNADLPGQFINIKLMVQAIGGEQDQSEYIKLQLSLENGNIISALQTTFSNGQMLNSQIKSIKYFPDLIKQLRIEKTPEKNFLWPFFLRP